MKDGYKQTSKGSIPVQVIKYPAPIPKIKKIVGYQYKIGGKWHKCQRPDDIPKKGRMIVFPIFQEYQLGMLRWMLEKKFSVIEMLSMDMIPVPGSKEARNWGASTDGKGIRRRTIAPTNPRGEYIGLYPLQIPDESLSYFEPTRDWFELLKKTTYETASFNEQQRHDALAKHFENLDEGERRAAAAKEADFEALFEETVIELQKGPIRAVHFDLAKR